MILAVAARRKKTIARAMLALLYLEMVIPPFASGASFTKAYYNESVFEKHVSVTSNKVADMATVTASSDVVKMPDTHIAAPEKAEGGPTQPEMQEFHSVNSDNMVDLFTGDFSYSIPLMDVGGYPIAIGYNSGITMDQEASWTGLGWNLNPGTVTRNVRGIPDDLMVPTLLPRRKT